jgi:hypothetical protein
MIGRVPERAAAIFHTCLHLTSTYPLRDFLGMMAHAREISHPCPTAYTLPFLLFPPIAPRTQPDPALITEYSSFPTAPIAFG